jgi:3,4-dihydroxy 2-butanone 4-phosphate synthase/GTP cyclohydrolase II
VLAWHGQALANGQLEQLQRWALKQGLQVEREEHPRLLALLDQPQLAVLLGGLDHAASGVGAVAAALVLMGDWPQTERLSLLLAPDGQRSSHPSADLESEQRPLADLGTDLILQPGAFLVWR